MFYGDFSGEKGTQFKQALAWFPQNFKRMFAADNLITFNRNQTFLKDEAFLQAFKDNAHTEQEKSLVWRLHTLAWAARHCQHIAGDFVECGVYKGFSMSVIAQMLDFGSLDKTMYLYDTYEGIPEEYNSEKRSNRVYEQEKDLYGQVVSKFKAYPNVKVVKGIVPLVFEETCPKSIALWHMDMNSSKSEMDALHAIYDRVSPGGMIVFDDFGWLGYDKQTWAEVDFMKERGHMILELPTGQGVVIKRPA